MVLKLSNKSKARRLVHLEGKNDSGPKSRDSGFQKILLNKDLLPSFKTKLHLPDSILKAEEGHLGGSVGWASDFGSGHDLVVTSSSPASGSVLTAQSLEPVSDSVSPSLSAHFPLMLSFCLSLSKINKCEKNLKTQKERRHVASAQWAFAAVPLWLFSSLSLSSGTGAPDP